MDTYFLTFFITFLLSASIVFLAAKKNWFMNQNDSGGVQKFHKKITPHVGGLAIYFGLIFGLYFLGYEARKIMMQLIIVSTPIFFIGLIEDLTSRVSPALRMYCIIFSIACSFYFLDIKIDNLDISWTDQFLSIPIISLLFTLLVLGGSVNSFNVIDGFNGLMLGFVIITLSAFIYVAFLYDDKLIINLCFFLISSIGGLFVLNFPFGKIFTGDGGAYLIGFLTSSIGLFLASRHEDLSNWFVLAILMYPMYELLFSIIRKRLVMKKPASQPDSFHLHMMIFRFIEGRYKKLHPALSNSFTSPILWVLSLPSVIPALVFHNDKLILIFICCIYMFLYTTFYIKVYRKNF